MKPFTIAVVLFAIALICILLAFAIHYRGKVKHRRKVHLARLSGILTDVDVLWRDFIPRDEVDRHLTAQIREILVSYHTTNTTTTSVRVRIRSAENAYRRLQRLMDTHPDTTLFLQDDVKGQTFVREISHALHPIPKKENGEPRVS